MLSLASSSIFLLIIVVFFFTITNQTTSPLFAFIARHGGPLLFVPVLLPCFALVRLARLRFLRKSRVPFFDGWFIHLAILLPYAIVLVALIQST